MLCISIAVLALVLIVVIKAWIKELSTNYFESKINKEIKELKEEKE